MGMRKLFFVAFVISVFVIPAASFAAESVGDQIEAGKQLYVKHCAACHGDAGQGGKKAPPVVGKDALPLNPPASAKVRTSKFHTALDVGEFVMKQMPAKKPGSLTTDEYLAILAFDLTANGVKLDGKLTPEAAKKIVLHP